MAQSQSYVNPRSIVATVVIFPVLASIAVGLRIWSRRIKKAGLGLDDYLSIVASVLLLGCSIDLLVGRVHHTVGYRTPPGAKVDFASFDGITLLNKVELSFNLMWTWGITLVKLSFLFFYRRIFRGKAFEIVNWTVIALVLSWGIAFFWAELFMCHEHIAQIWNPIPPFLNPKCVSSVAIFFANSLTSCALDVMIFIIPIPLVWQLNLSLKAKLALSGMFSIGGLCIAASTLRLVLFSSLWWAVISHNMNPTIFGLSGVDDFGIVSLGLFWSLVELGVACIACCLPSLKPLLGSELLKNLPSTFSAFSLHSIKEAVGIKYSSEGTNRQALEASWRETGDQVLQFEALKADPHDLRRTMDTSHPMSFREDSCVSTHNIIEGGNTSDISQIEAGQVLRTVEIGQTSTDGSSVPHLRR